MSSAERTNREKRLELVNGERKHLEGLLKDRIHFYLLFASVFTLGLSRIDDQQVKVWALATGTTVSFLIGLAIVRTHLLVEQALTEVTTYEEHPYGDYRARVRFPPNANKILIFVPFILTIFFAAVTTYYLLAY